MDVNNIRNLAECGATGGGSVSDLTNARPPRKRKSKSGKGGVWEKVVWFTRRSHRSREVEDLPDGAHAAAAPMLVDCDSGQSSPKDAELPWSESSSSSEVDDGASEQKSAFPNSEVIEQHCLRPSVARALFQQMEVSNLYPCAVKPPWQKRKSKRPLSLTVDALTVCGNSRVDLPLVGTMPRFYESSNPYVFEYHCGDDEDCKKRSIAQPEDEAGASNLNVKRSSCSDLQEFEYWYSRRRHYYSLPSRISQNGILRQDNRVKCSAATSRSSLSLSPCIHSLSRKRKACPVPPKSKTSPSEFKARTNLIATWFSEFNDEQKNLLLKDILNECGLPQIHLLSLKIEPRLHEGCPPNCQDIITWVPTSIALYIFSFLDPVSLCRSSLVCKTWQRLADEVNLWQKFCYLPHWRLSTTCEQKQLLNNMLTDGNVNWKAVFGERYKLRNNWLRGKCNIRTFEGHTQGISCVQFDDTRIVSGSSDKTIKVWNIRTNTPWSVQTLVGHSGTVRCLHLEGNRLVSGSADNSIKVWDLSMQHSWSSIACKVTMVGHTDTVRCLQVDDEKIISGSYDKCLKIWDMRTGECRNTLRGHEAAVLSVQFDDRKIISGAGDKTIKVWDFDGQCLMTLQGHRDAVTCLQFDETTIISGSLDCTLKFWNVNTGLLSNTIDWKDSEGHTGVVRCLQADSWRIVSASDDKTLKVWNLETKKRLTTLRNHTDGVTCLQFNDSIIVSGSYDKTVKLWDFSC